MRNALEIKKKKRHREFLEEIVDYHRKFQEFHKRKYAILKKKAISAKGYLEWLGRREQAAHDRADKERMKALKANDMSTYINLLNTTKNSRLLDILKQTDEFLR
mmetsp:Transcript_5319/g.3064  ORF Transcript_5319/g.3064 Transcript_5319/m.3064 type:complete len:104 (-) Transcript_5319:894-1205(-)